MKKCISCFAEYEEKYNMCPYCGYYEGQQETPLQRLPHGTILNDRFIVGKTLGKGGFAITYKAWDKKLNKVVAIKEYYPSGLVNRPVGTKDIVLIDKKAVKEFKSGYSRLLDEARYVSGLGGEYNTLYVDTFFEENNTSYMVMEYVKGVQLKDIVKKRGKMSVEEVRYFAKQICKTLKYVHSKKIIHRDIAPDNIMIDCDSNYNLIFDEDDNIVSGVTLIDYGNARFKGVEDPENIIVKDAFSPIEQYDAVKKQGEWTDIYALGATMYYALTGVVPSSSKARANNDDFIPPYEIDDSIPENISNIVVHAMEVYDQFRYTSISEIEKDLGKERVKIVRKPLWWKRFVKYSSVAAVVVAILGVTMLWMTYYAKKSDTHLPKNTTIEVWIMADDSGNKEKALNSIISSFEKMYEADNIDVNLVVIPADEYQDRLDEAVQDNDLPEVFENDVTTNKYMDHTDVVKNIINDAYRDIYFADDLSDIAKEKEVLIYGFDMPVVYVNKSLCEQEVTDYNSVLNIIKGNDVTQYTNRAAFISGKEKVFYGHTSDYTEVQKALPAQYKMIKVNEKAECKGSIGFSISESDDNEHMVAERFLFNMYSDASADYMFVQNYTATLPVNKKGLETFEQTYLEYKGFFENIKEYVLN